MYLELLLTAAAAALLLQLLRSHGRLSRALQTREASLKGLSRFPSVTVIRPIKGVDVGAEQNLRAALDHGYPGHVQTLFVFDDESEPVYPLVERLLAERRGQGTADDAEVLFAGHPPAGRTGKLHAMIVGLRHAKGELVAFADSDIRPARRALTQLLATLLADPKAGSAFAPVVAALQPETIGDAGYTLLLNGLYGGAAAAAAEERGGKLPFIMGQFMVFRREALASIGGLESAEGQLVDDMYIGARIAAAGYENRVSPQVVPIIQEGLTFGEFIATYRRWITFSRTGLPGWAFKMTSILQGVVFWSGLIIAGVAISQGLTLAGALALAAPLGVGLSINRLHRAVGGAPLKLRHFWVSVGLLLMAPVVYLSIYMRHQVNWRGRVYQLDGKSFLADGAPLPADQLDSSDERRARHPA